MSSDRLFVEVLMLQFFLIELIFSAKSFTYKWRLFYFFVDLAYDEGGNKSQAVTERKQ